MRVPFTKVEGCANDFVVVDLRVDCSSAEMVRAHAPQICDRRRGVGADGVLLLVPGDDGLTMMRVINADGSESEMCGNGIRCVALCMSFLGEISEVHRIQTLAGILDVECISTEADQAMFRVNMGRPILKPALIPTTLGDVKAVDQALATPIGIAMFTCVSMGNPHAVTFVDSLDKLDIAAIGPAIENHPAFPRRTNVEFALMESHSQARVRVWERGSGETMACGTGACAVAVAANITSRGSKSMDVILPGGKLRIDWDGGEEPVFMTGPARISYSGVMRIGETRCTAQID
ncbi:MAG: diaminopimelate epimerase [Candidatus Brocadiia bacterium]